MRELNLRPLALVARTLLLLGGPLIYALNSEFDTAHMTKLFVVGYQKARTGFPWAKNTAWLQIIQALGACFCRTFLEAR